MAASRSLEEEETLRGVIFESAHPAELVAGRTLELRAQIQKSWTDEQFEIHVESRRGPVRGKPRIARGEHKLAPRSHRICDGDPLPQIIT
jgi:hypothetical protein